MDHLPTNCNKLTTQFDNQRAEGYVLKQVPIDTWRSATE